VKARCSVCGRLVRIIARDGTVGSHGFPRNYRDGRYGTTVYGCRGIALLPIPGNGDDSHLPRDGR
jgi:hypothetical protein